MVSIKNDRLFVLEKEGRWVEFPKKINYMHRDCLEEYADKKAIPFSNVENVVKETGSAVFYNIDDRSLVAILPADISDEQSYQLDTFSLLSLDDINHMEIRKLNKEKDEFSLTNDVANRFATEVIQSYYEKNDSSKTR